MTQSYLLPIQWPEERQNMYWAVRERQKERFDGWKTYLLDRFFPLTKLHYPSVIGTFAWTSSAIKRKWIMKSQASNITGLWVTPGDLARDYLAIKYKDRRLRCTTPQYQACVRDRRHAPIFAIPSELEHGLYVDIKAAYWSIVQAVGWDVNYMPGGYIGVNSSMADFPFYDDKMARNCLVSCALPGGFRFWDGYRLSFKNKPNQFVNLLLWRLVCDVLNAIAADMVDVGAIYVHTDGYIIPYSAMADAREVMESWAMPYGIKHEGHCIVRAPAEYEFPDYKTHMPPRKKPIAIDGIYREKRSWLKLRMYHFGSQRISREG